MTTLLATGTYSQQVDAPSIHVSGGRGNNDNPESPEVHLMLRIVDPVTETTQVVMGWFEAKPLLDAIYAASSPGGTTPPVALDSAVSRRRQRVTEPLPSDEAA